jgi:predicted dehydrogenase
MRSRTTTRVAVVGYGYWGTKHARVLDAMPDVEITICDGRPERTAEARRQFPKARLANDLTDVVQHVDAVVVATPPSTHARVALQSIEAGRHTLVEKPLATSPEEAHAIVDAAAERHVGLMVGHTFEYHAAVWKLKEIVASGELGRILYIDSARLNLGLYRNDVDVIWDLAPHDLSIISFILGEMPSSVTAWTHRNFGRRHADVAYLGLDFAETAARAFVRLSWLHPVKVRHVTVVGDRKMAVYDDLADQDRIRIYDTGVDPIFAADPDLTGVPISYRAGDVVSPYVAIREPLLVQDSHFIDCVRSGRRPDTPGERGLDVVRVLSALDRAQASGQTVPVDPHEGTARLAVGLAGRQPVLARPAAGAEVLS